MNSTPPDPPPPPARPQPGPTAPPLPSATDPKLAEFQRRAEALVALAHGLTAPCRMKLASLAHELGLTDDELQTALRRLQDGGAPEAPPAPADVRKAEFQAYLRTRLAKLATPVLDPSREAKYVATAAERFALDAPAALETIGRTADELRVRRISRAEATQIVDDMIVEKLGPALWMEHAVAQRLIVAAQVWGLSAEEIEQRIQAHAETNRARKAAVQRRLRLLAGAGALALAGLIGLGVWASVEQRRRAAAARDAEASGAAGTAAVAAVEPQATRPAGPPEWWNSRLAVAVAQARSGHESFSPIYQRLIDVDPAARGAGYEKLLDWSALPAATDEGRRSPESLARDILAVAHADDPDDEAARRLRGPLVALVAALRDRNGATPRGVRRAAWAVETIVQSAALPANDRPRGAELLAALAEPLRVALPADAKPPELRRQAGDALARLAFSVAVRDAAADPARALEMHDAAREAGAHLPPDEFQRLQTALVVAALPAAGDDWGRWRGLLQECVAARDPALFAPLVDLYERAGDSPWRSTLGELLVARADVRSDPAETAATARAVREALGLTAAAAPAGLPVDVWQRLRDPSAAALARQSEPSDDPAELLARAVELAHWSTLAAAAAQGEAGRAVWEAAWRDGPPETERGGAGDVSVRDLDGAPAVDPRLAQQRKTLLQRASGALAHYERLDSLQRIGALRELAALAAAVPDVAPPQGQAIARYLLATRPEGELREAAEPARLVLGWRQVRLGVADHLESSKLPPAMLADMLGPLLGRTVDADEATERRAALRREILKTVLSSGTRTATDSERRAVRARKVEAAAGALQTIYARRAALAGVEAVALPAEALPGRSVEAIVRRLAAKRDSGGAKSEEARRRSAEFAREAAAADFQSVTDPHRLVAWGRLYLRLQEQELARLRPDLSAAAAALVSPALDSPPPARRLLEQLVALEACQLRLWSLAAEPPDSPAASKTSATTTPLSTSLAQAAADVEPFEARAAARGQEGGRRR